MNGVKAMTEVVIVDTDILIDVGRSVNKAIEYLQELESRRQLAVSVVTQRELIIGCRNKSELHDLEYFLKRFLVLPLNKVISNKAVELLRCYRLSHSLLIADAFIAATAISLGYSLASKNQRDYRFIPELDLLPYP